MSIAVRWDELNIAEKALIEAIKNDESWWPSPEFLLAASKKRNVSRRAGDGDVRPTVRAKVLRAILTGAHFEQPKGANDSAGQPIAIGPGGLSISPPTVDVAGPPVRVRVEGALDLNGLCGPGGTVTPPITLEYCDFDSTIDMRGAHIAALSLAGSRFSAVRLTDAEVRGRVDLSWCEPTDGPPGSRDETTYASAELDSLWPFAGNSFERRDDAASGIGTAFHPLEVETPDPERPLPQCIVLLGNTSIDGNVDIYGARFIRRFDAVDPFRNDGTRVTEALSLAGAVIAGSVRCIRSVIIGGVALRDAHVRESIRFAGCRLVAYESSKSIDMQMVCCDGLIALTGSLHESEQDAPLLKRRLGLSSNVLLGQLFALGATARYFWVSDGIILSGGGPFREKKDTQFFGPAIILDNADVSGSIWLGAYSGDNNVDASVAALGSVTVCGTRIDGNVQVSHFGATRAGSATVAALLPMASAFVRESLGYYNDFCPEYCSLDVRSASIGNEMRVERSRLHGINNYASPDCDYYCAVSIRNADIGKGLVVGQAVDLIGELCMTHAQVGKFVSINCRSITPFASSGTLSSAIDATGAVVDGDFRILGVGLFGAAVLANAQAKGDCEISNCRFHVPSVPQGAFGETSEPDRLTMMSLNAAQIGGRLLVNQLGWGQSAPPLQASKLDPVALASAGAVQLSAQSLPFLDDYLLIEYLREIEAKHVDASLAGTPDGERLISVKRQLLHDSRSDEFWPLDGNSWPIHNARSDVSRFRLDNPATEQAYLAFFCGSLQSDEGSFRIVRHVEGSVIDYPEYPEASDAGVEDDPVRRERGNMLRNMPLGSLERTSLPDGRVGYYATVLYGAMLSNTLFALSPTGEVEMLDDLPIALLKTKPMPDKGIDRTVSAPNGIAFFTFGTPIRAPDIGRTPAHANSETSGYLLVDLERLNCGLIDDDFGNGWNLTNRTLIRAAGILCREVEPSGERPSAAGGAEGTDRFNDASANPVQKNPLDRRLGWLKQQFAVNEGRQSEPGWLLRRLPPRWLGRENVNPQAFVPQTWDMFANAYMRAGESPAARQLMIERKDIEALVLSQEARAWVYGSGPAMAANEPDESKVWRAIRLLAICAVLPLALIVLASWLLQWPWAFTLDNVGLLLLLASGIVATVVALLPLLVLGGALLFRAGFKYGLSAPRAIGTFFFFIAIGALGTHVARTGEPISLSTDWRSLSEPDGRLDPDIALVLSAGYSANAPATAGPTARNGTGPLQGTLVYGAAAPCNLGVSSWQYAMDVFIPVLDLDQESRCSIREEPESTGSYNGWRWLKILYEIMGWIVTSLTILTITGVMRRDMER